jgi:Tfp pilus assembly protein PilZ
MHAGDERPFFFPATVLAIGSIPVAWGLLSVQRAAYIWMYIHVGAWLMIGGATAYFVKTNHEYLFFAMSHVVLTSLPFLFKNARAPFLFSDGRGFRTVERHDINLKSFLEVDGARREAETMDLSQRGAYVACDTAGLAVGQRVIIQMHLRANKFLRLPAHVMSLNANGSDTKVRGIGVQFSHLTEHDQTNIEHFITEGRRQSQMRAPVKLRASFVWEQRRHDCDVYGLTLNGCYLDDRERVLQPGDKVSLLLHLHEGDTIEVVAEVMWLPEDATIVQVTNTRGSATEFRNLSKRDAQRITERLQEAGIGEK